MAKSELTSRVRAGCVPARTVDRLPRARARRQTVVDGNLRGAAAPEAARRLQLLLY